MKKSLNAYPDIVVVVGSNRSGKSFLANALLNATSLSIPPSSASFIVPTYRKLHHFGNLENPNNLRKLARTIHTTFREFEYLHKVENLSTSEDEILERALTPTYTGVLYAVFQLIADKRGKSQLGCEYPIGVKNMPLLLELMPTARFVHIIRDGRGVANALLKLKWGANNVYGGARWWQRNIVIARRDGNNMPERYFELRVEDLVTDTEKTAKELLTFINREQNPGQIKELVDWINQKKNVEKLNAWKGNLSERERYICEAAAGDMLRACGYPTEFGNKARISPVIALYYTSVDRSLRMKNRLTRKKRPLRWQQ